MFFNKTTGTHTAKKLLNNNWKSAIISQLIILSLRSGILVFQILGLNYVNNHQLLPDLNPFPNLLNYTFKSNDIEILILILSVLFLDLLIISPLILGKINLYKKIVSGEPGKVKYMFSFWGKNYFKAIRWRFAKFIKWIFYFTLCLAPYSIVVGYSNHLRTMSENISNSTTDLQLVFCTVVKIPVAILGILLFFLILLRYSALPYILIETANGSKIKRKTKLSMKTINGHLLDLGSLYAKYAIISIAGIFIVPMFIIIPLFQVEKAMLIKNAAKSNLESKDKKEEKDFSHKLEPNEITSEVFI